jgi:hypothetical protein
VNVIEKKITIKLNGNLFILRLFTTSGLLVKVVFKIQQGDIEH